MKKPVEKYCQNELIESNTKGKRPNYKNWEDSEIQEGICMGLSLKWTQLHFAKKNKDRKTPFIRHLLYRDAFIDAAALQIVFNITNNHIYKLGINFGLQQTGQPFETQDIAKAAKHVLGTPGYHQFSFWFTGGRRLSRLSGHATACYNSGESGPGAPGAIHFFDPNYGEYWLFKNEFLGHLKEFMAQYYKGFLDGVVISIMGPKDKDFLRDLRDVCIEYKKSLTKFFRRPSKESKNACTNLEQVWATKDVPKLIKMVRWYMGFDSVKITPEGPSFGSPLKDDSTFKQILKKAFHGNTDVFFLGKE